LRYIEKAIIIKVYQKIGDIKMKLSTFKDEIKKSYARHFPESRCGVNYSGTFYKSVSINCYLAGDTSEFSSGIRHNDPLGFQFSVFADVMGQESELPRIGDDDELPEELILVIGRNSYSTAPTEKYMAFGHRKVSARKTRGDAKKIVKYLDAFFSKARGMVVEDYMAGNLHSSHVELFAKKLNVQE